MSQISADEILSRIASWAARAIQHGENFHREYGFMTPETAGRVDAYQAVLNIIAEGRAEHGPELAGMSTAYITRDHWGRTS